MLLHTLLHELRHAQQHLANINMNTQNKILCKKIEQDADRFATYAMPCIICLMILQHTAFNKKHHEGYFSKSDFTPYINRAVECNQFCKSHNQIPKSQLCQFTFIDHTCGTLQDRIPEKIQALPFFSKLRK